MRSNRTTRVSHWTPTLVAMLLIFVGSGCRSGCGGTSQGQDLPGADAAAKADVADTDCTPSPDSCQDACSDEGQICTDNGHQKVSDGFYVIGDNLPCTDASGICCSGACLDVTVNSCPTE